MKSPFAGGRPGRVKRKNLAKKNKKEDESKAPPMGVIPHLTIGGGKCNEAIEFYTKALGATQLSKHLEKNGAGPKVMHASMQLHGSQFYLNDCFPEFTGGKANDPASLGGSTVYLNINCTKWDEVDQWHDMMTKTKDAGLKVMMPPADQPWGGRYAMLCDPFGHVWTFHGPTKIPAEKKDGEGAKKEEDAEEEEEEKPKKKGKKGGKKAPAKKKQKTKKDAEEEEGEGDED